MKTTKTVLLTIFTAAFLVSCNTSSQKQDASTTVQSEQTAEEGVEQESLKNYFKKDADGNFQELVVNVPVGAKGFKSMANLPIYSTDKTKAGFIVVVSDGKGSLFGKDGTKLNVKIENTYYPINLKSMDSLQVFFYNDDLQDLDYSFIKTFQKFLNENPVGNYSADEIVNAILDKNIPKGIGGGTGVPHSP